jgi:hypothetical protein
MRAPPSVRYAVRHMPRAPEALEACREEAKRCLTPIRTLLTSRRSV